MEKGKKVFVYAVGMALLAMIAGAAFALRQPSERQPTSQAPANKELVVFAAASLRDVFADVSKAFALQHPGVQVVFSFAGSQDLAAQIRHGAKADVIAAADVAHVDGLASEKLVLASQVFACNEPVIVVSQSSAAGIVSFQDLPKAKNIVLGAAAVPIGKYAEQILQKAEGTVKGFSEAVMGNVVSRELTVRHVLSKVALGEADAGIVYRTDAAGSKQVVVVPIPAEFNVTARYPIAVLSGSSAPAMAQEWKDFLVLGEGQKIMQQAGFGCPQ